MLTRIEIHDFALLESIVLAPGPGLLILTGETGAGKSILIDAISALSGERISRDMIRHDQERASIEAVFQDDAGSLPSELIEQLGLDNADDDLILSREILATGKSVCRINGRLVSMSLLQELAGWLIDIHGQHDQQAIFRTALHLQLLDRFGGQPVDEALQAYQAAWEEYQACRHKLANLGQDPAERARQGDMLQYQIHEIEAARIKPGEDEQLADRRRVVANAAKIGDLLGDAYQWLDGDSSEAVLGKLTQIVRNIEQAERLLASAQPIGEQVREALYLLQNMTGDIRSAIESVETSPGELDRIDERLDQLFRLKKKYGGSLPEIQRYMQKAKARLEEMADSEALYERLQEQSIKLQQRLDDEGAKLSAARRKAAAGMEARIMQELASLNMKGVRFAVLFQDDDHHGSYDRNGLDKVEFLLAANPGEPLKPLARIASGGEASRIMLAIKSILADADRIPVLIFDEIDSGVSGMTAGKVAEKLQVLSRGRQVFCITHLAQIAAMADSHVLIEKKVSGGVTRTQLRTLAEKDREQELARLLSGGVGDAIARDLAGSLLQESRKFRRPDVPAGKAGGANS